MDVLLHNLIDCLWV